MDASRLIVWFLGLAALLSLGIVALISLRQLPAPQTLDHIAVGAVSALAGAMTVGRKDGEPNNDSYLLTHTGESLLLLNRI